MRVVLVFGCHGRKHGNFQVCGGVENEILDLSTDTDINRKIAEFLDSVYHLFDRPLYSNVHTALFKIQNNFSETSQSIFTEERFRQMEEFCTIHAKCGLFLRLRLFK